MRKVSLVFCLLFLLAGTISAISGQFLPVVFNVLIAGIWMSIYIKLPSAR